MSLSANQKRYLIQHLHLWCGLPLDIEIPFEYVSLILGLSENELPFFDRRGNKDFQHNPLFWAGHILEPVINRWLHKEINKCCKIKGNQKPLPVWPDGKTFAVCLTHDVDLITINSLPGMRRYLMNKLRSQNRGKAKIKNWAIDILRLMNSVAKSLLFSGNKSFFEPWLELEDKFGFRSTFFFFPDQASYYHLLDGAWYRYHDELFFEGCMIKLQELMQQLETRGWEVGLHGTFASFDDSQELRKQKEQIETFLGSQIVSIRQHNLHFDISKTPKAQSQAGFKYDSTFGFNRIIGFRNGLAFPFYHYDLQEDQSLPILQIPLHIQDTALLRADNLDLAPELALCYAKDLIDKVENINGLVTLLWHPNVYNDKHCYGWYWVYEELLKYIATKDAWVAPVREIGAWWENLSKKGEIS